VRGEGGGEQIGLSIYKQKGQTFDRFASGQAWEIWQQQLSKRSNSSYQKDDSSFERGHHWLSERASAIIMRATAAIIESNISDHREQQKLL
jgi:hypothetical protein